MVTHNIQIGVNVDEESIRNFEREVLEPLLTDIFSSDDFKELVAEKTAVIMADKLAKSKKFKDAVDSNLK